MRRLWRHRVRRRQEAAGTGAVFADDLLESRLKDLPREHLHVLLNVPGFGVGKGHDKLEELLAFRFSL
jgi:hypothetical protein